MEDTNNKCIIKDSKGEDQILQYHFCGKNEFSLSGYLPTSPTLQAYKWEYLGEGKIYSINDVLQGLRKQTTSHFWKILYKK